MFIVTPTSFLAKNSETVLPTKNKLPKGATKSACPNGGIMRIGWEDFQKLMVDEKDWATDKKPFDNYVGLFDDLDWDLRTDCMILNHAEKYGQYTSHFR